LYHYTSQESLTQIITSKLFYPSYLNPQMDTAYGEGWYFTDLKPDTTPDEDLQQSIWMRPEPLKCRGYIAVEIDDSLLENCRHHVYRVKSDAVPNKVIDLSITYTFISTGKQAIRYITQGRKQIVHKQYNTFKTLGIIVLIGLLLWALSRS